MSSRKPADPTETLPLSLPTLYKKSAGKGVVQWDISVLPGENGTAVIKTVWGTQGGKLQEALDTISAGKKLGSKAETSPEGQAILEAKATWKKKLERGGYGLDALAEESAAKRGVSPMLALSYDDYKGKLPSGVSLFMQPKLDGHRCIAHVTRSSVTLFSRKGEEITTMEHIKEDLLAILKEVDLPHDLILVDGEMFTHDTDFDGIASAVRGKKDKDGVEKARLSIQYFIYDAYVPSKPELLYSERWDLINNHLGVGRPRTTGRGWSLRQVPTVACPENVHEAVTAYATECVTDRYEGAMLRVNLPYEPGKRSKTLLKVKFFTDAEFEVLDALPGDGSHSDMAIFVCKMPDGKKFTVTAPGTHEEKKMYLAEKKLWIGKKLTVKYWPVLTPEGLPRFPVAKAFREDI
jgi:ATP-dependent DNA ligase